MVENIVINIIEYLKYFLIFQCFLNGKVISRKRFCIGTIEIILICFATSILKHRDAQLILIVGILVYVLWIYEGRIKNKILIYTESLICINYLDTISCAISGGLFKGNMGWYFLNQNRKILMIQGVLSLVCIIIIICIKMKINKRKINWFIRQISIMQCTLLSGAMAGLYFVLATMILFVAYREPNHRYKLYILLATATLLILSCILAFFLYSNHLKKENDLKTKNIEAQKENDGLRLALYANMEMMDDDMRQYRHDNRHHRAVLRELASKGDLEEIKDYLVQLSEQDEDLKKKNVLYTGNYMVDAIINGIIAKEAYSDVKFHCEGKLPRKLMIQDVDLSGLLSNGLENAAEACLHSNGDKCVLFKAASYENMIHFEIKNTYDSTRYKALSKGDFETTKKNSEYHGYGIESMRCVVKKYDGKLEYIVEPEWVITDIYLQQKDEI